MRQATINAGRHRRQVLAAFLDALARRSPGLRFGGTRVQLLSVAAFRACEAISLKRSRSVWREEPRAAIRRTMLLYPVVLTVLIAATVLAFEISPGWGAAVEVSILVAVVLLLLVGPGWVRVADAHRTGLSLRVLAPKDGRARIALGRSGLCRRVTATGAV